MYSRSGSVDSVRASLMTARGQSQQTENSGQGGRRRRMVDCGLATNRRVDLREQRRRNLDQRHAPLVCRRRETGEVADDASAQCDQDRRAFRADLEQPRVDVIQRSPVLVCLAIGHDDGFMANRGRGQR